MGIRRKIKPKIIVILGPTASGKSDLAVSIAKKFNGEIISADSRQVYKGMDIGSGKITKKEMMGIPHHLIDIASPRIKFSVSRYRKIASKKINKIIKENKIPIICGGTAFYIKVLIQGIDIPEIKPDWKLRKKLEKESPELLYIILKKIDPKRADSIEKENPRRLIRALEIIMKSEKPVPEIKKNPEYSPLCIGIKKDNLNERIEIRLDERLKNGMISEVENLRHNGLSWKRLESFGLEYEWISKYLQKKISYQEMRDNLLRDIIKFSKKQMSWWKNDKKIKWVKDAEETENLVNKFLK